MKIAVRGILFDMDGVLVSSIGSVERSWTRWAQAHGVDPALAIRMAHGRRAIETLEFLRPDLNSQEELLRLEEVEMEDNGDLKILPGVQRILHTLPPSRWAVVTSATERLALRRLRDGGVLDPPQLVSADKVSKGKPDPEPYLTGATLLGLPPEACLVIEDAASGVQAGHAAGCKVLATLFSHPLESLSAADWIVRSLEDVRVSVAGDQIEIEFEPVAPESKTDAG
ncbi:MAG: HAD-IA family hydrolase [Acidobacteriaceae bacterium]